MLDILERHCLYTVIVFAGSLEPAFFIDFKDFTISGVYFFRVIHLCLTHNHKLMQKCLQ